MSYLPDKTQPRAVRHALVVVEGIRDAASAGIEREAYIETIVELASEGLTDLTTFTPDQMQTVFELYATHAIEARICNDIGTKAVTMPADAQAAHRVEQQLRDFIRGAVSDALTRAQAKTPNLTLDQIQGFVDTVYESAFAILQALGDAGARRWK